MGETIRRIHAMFREEGSGAYSEPGVVCPFCGPRHEHASNVHLDKAEQFPGHDAYDASQHYGIGVRGDVTVLHFWCEEGGHRWVLVFGEHKGGIMVKLI